VSLTKLDLKLRVSLWRANDRRCFFCGEPIEFRDLEIDHIIPEGLTTAVRNELLERLHLPPDFDLNSLRNLVPTHHHCNGRKGGMQLPDNAILLFQAVWDKKQTRVAGELARYREDGEHSRHLTAIGHAIQGGRLTKQEVLQFVARLEQPKASVRNDPLVVTFGANVSKVIETGSLPTAAGNDYVHVCDWLEKDLVYRVAGALPILSQRTEASARNGEALSVRLAFWNIDVDQLSDLGLPQYWEVTEIAHFSDLYETSPHDLLAKAVVTAQGLEISDPFDPVYGLGRCPRCGSTKLTRTAAVDPVRGDVYPDVTCDECGWIA